MPDVCTHENISSVWHLFDAQWEEHRLYLMQAKGQLWMKFPLGSFGRADIPNMTQTFYKEDLFCGCSLEGGLRLISKWSLFKFD